LHRRPRHLPPGRLRLLPRKPRPQPNLRPSRRQPRPRPPPMRRRAGSGRDASKVPRAANRRCARLSLRTQRASHRARRANDAASAANESRPDRSRLRMQPRRLPDRRPHRRRQRRPILATLTAKSAGNIASAPAMRVPHTASRRVKRRRPRHRRRRLRHSRPSRSLHPQTRSRMRHPPRLNPCHRRKPPRPRPRHLEIRSPASVTAGAMASADHRPTSNDSHRNRLNLQRRPPVSRPLQQNPAASLRHPRRPARPRARAPALTADSSAVPLRSRR
jgi:hypothetical protein